MKEFDKEYIGKYDKEYIGKYKDQKAYSYFDSGFVGEILVSKINEGTKSLVLQCPSVHKYP